MNQSGDLESGTYHNYVRYVLCMYYTEISYHSYEEISHHQLDREIWGLLKNVICNTYINKMSSMYLFFSLMVCMYKYIGSAMYRCNCKDMYNSAQCPYIYIHTHVYVVKGAKSNPNYFFNFCFYLPK